MKREWLAMVLLGAWAPAMAAKEGAQDLLTRGKLETDSGDQRAAAATFLRVADDKSAPPALKWEALVRLGLARKQLGDARGAAQAFGRVWDEYGREKEARRLLVEAVYGALPGSDRWDAIWQEVDFKVTDAATARPVVAVEWPGVPQASKAYTGTPATLNCADCPLTDVLRILATTAGLNLIAHPGHQKSLGTITLQARNMPWDEALDRVLTPNGLVARRTPKVLEVGRPEQLARTAEGAAERAKAYTGAPVSLDLADGDLQDIFRLFADITQLNVVVHPGTRGKATAKVKDMPWDKALDLILATNGLAAHRVGNLIEIGQPERLGKLQHFEGAPIDIDYARADLRDVLRQMAEKGGKTLAVEPELAQTLKGMVTLKLLRVPWDQAFDIVVRVNGLAWKPDGVTLRVGRPAQTRP
jgi:type II secretory pathway component HofQ